MKFYLAPLFVTALATTAFAEVSDIEVPVLVLETDEIRKGLRADEALDLANIVQTAAKGLTTVQEAPAIVTVVTAEDIRDRQFRDLLQLVDSIPGWQRINVFYGMFPTPSVRGHVQAVQILHDGLSLFDPAANVPTIGRETPMELVKRVELITGPGGVLWGSNSLMGIMNVTTKDAEDVDGVETGATLGHGPGDRLVGRAYVMAGATNVLDRDIKLFGHSSIESYQGARLTNPMMLFHSPIPQPNSRNTYGALASSDQPQSLFVNFLGKATVGKLQVRAQYPFGMLRRPLGISGNPLREDIEEDSRCSPDGYTDSNGVFQPGGVDPTCVDNLRSARDTRWRQFDRYAVAEYRDSIAKDRAQIMARGYVQQFARGLEPMTVFSPSSLVQGGLSFNGPMTSWRTGGALEAGIQISDPFRVLFGGEAFREWLPDTTEGSRSGGGSETTFRGPYDVSRLPILCPRRYDSETMTLVPLPGCPITFAFETSRTVLGAYVNPQLRPTKKVILDAGVRVQAAPDALGTLGYAPNITAAGTVVWSFIEGWHAKLNYTQGFRPPVFNNTSSNGEAVQIAGNANLEVERSSAWQGEINARVFKGQRSIRELSFRIDGSFTRLQNMIQVERIYRNTGDRGVASAELLAKLHVQGGHRLELAYTWMRIASADRGRVRALPENWLNFTTVANLATNRLTAMANLRVMGAMQDSNRLVEYRDTSIRADGAIMNPVEVGPSDLVFDTLPPIADLSLGVTWTPNKSLLVRATIHNALAQHAYMPDVWFDYEPHLEYVPNPIESIRGYISATYQY